MSRPLTVPIRPFRPILALSLLCVFPLTGCERQYAPRVVQVAGSEGWWIVSPLYGLTFGATAEGDPTHILMRDGDGLLLDDLEGFIPVRASDGDSLDFQFDSVTVTLNGRVVVLAIDDDEGWAWLEGATPEDLAALRLVTVDTELTPERTPLLEKLALHNPEVSLVADEEEVLPPLLTLFDPETLAIPDVTVEEELKALLAREERLKTLWISGEEVSDLDFLREIPSLETLFVIGWEPEEIGPLPDGLANLRSVIVFSVEAEDLTILGNQPGLEEVALSACEADEDSPLDISALAHHPNLRTVCLRSCPWVTGLSALDSLPALDWLALSESTTQEQLEQVIRTHPDLTVLELIGSEAISDLTPLTELRKLKALLVGGSAPPDPLYQMKGLEYLAVVVEDDDSLSYGEDVLPRLREVLPETALARVEPFEFCLGSGFILLLIPMGAGAWWMTRRRRRGRRPVSLHG